MRIDPFDLRLQELEGQDILVLLESEIDQREQMIKFLEEQIQAWSRHPSASTWSLPQKDSD